LAKPDLTAPNVNIEGPVVNAPTFNKTLKLEAPDIDPKLKSINIDKKLPDIDLNV